MDIKEKIAEIVAKITKDPALAEKFKKDPAGTVKELAGNIPTDKIGEIVEIVSAKIGASGVGDKIGEIGDKLGGLFGK